jgi:hypothetical protein
LKLTIEENPEAIKRYRHIKPAPRGGTVTCSVGCPGTTRTCTLKRGHAGPHVAHGSFKKVMAVWDRGAQISSTVPLEKRAVTFAEKKRQENRFLAAFDLVRKQIAKKEHHIEEGFLILFGLAMVWFAIEWALRIIGVF